MTKRRALLFGAAGAVGGSLLGGCDRRKPDTGPLPSGLALPSAPTRNSNVLDLTGLVAKTPRPEIVTAAARSAARLWLDNTTQGRRNVLTATQVEPGLFVSAEHGRRQIVKRGVYSESDPIILTRYRARLAMADAAGKLVVMRATDATMIRDRVTDASMFKVSELPSGLAVASRAPVTDLEPGAVLHAVGYQAAFGESRFDIPINKPAPQAGVRMALLNRGGSQFHAVTGLGPSEGEVPAAAFAEGSSGGPIYSTQGRVVGTVLYGVPETVTVGNLIEGTQYGRFERVVINGEDVSSSTKLQVTTCQAMSDLLIGDLATGLAPIPSPGY